MSKIVNEVLQEIADETISDYGINEYFVSFVLNSERLKQVILSQQEKGIKKYGHSIDECPFDKFDWEEMFYEEIADALIYIEKSKRRENE